MRLAVLLIIVLATILMCINVAQLPETTTVVANAQAANVQPWNGDKRGLVLIGWNNLGMHCTNGRFEQMCILPPFNTVIVQVIQRGDPPRILSGGFTLKYRIENNTTVKGKTDFWEYAKDLFGQELEEGIGLAGKGLTGTLDPVGDHYEAKGIPVMPLDDKMKWNPFQVAVVSMVNASGHEVASTKVVLPVSDELNCQKCHADNGDANPDIATGTVEGNILTVHDNRNGTTLLKEQPVLCARCHADKALDAAGDGQRNSLSYSMHTWHAGITGDQPGCYDCHPGAVTRCLRTAVTDMGTSDEANPDCAFCHGGLADMADSLQKGRKPWEDEPTCDSCHGDSHPTGGKLYQQAVGHGGLACATCHNSPHAWWPSKLKADCYQPDKLQDDYGPIGSDCTVCHTKRKLGSSPHTKLDFTRAEMAQSKAKGKK